MTSGSTQTFVCETVWGGGILGKGGGPRQRTEQFGPPAFPQVTGIWHLRYCLMPEEWPVSSLFQSCIVQDTAVGCAQVRMCACEKVQIWRAVSNEVLAAALATCVLGSSVWVSVRTSHHGSVASRTSVLLSWMSSRRNTLFPWPPKTLWERFEQDHLWYQNNKISWLFWVSCASEASASPNITPKRNNPITDKLL